VHGRVLDSEGDPVVGSSVSAGLDDPDARAAGRMGVGFVMMGSSTGASRTIVGGSAGDMATATTDEQGRYELRGLRPETLVSVSAHGPGHSPRTSESFELARREVRQLDLEVLPAGSVRVEVLRADGSAAGSGFISAKFLDTTEERVEPRTSMLAGGGASNLSSLRPGRWEVRLQIFDPSAPGPPQSPLEPQVVEVVGGEQAQVSFELP